MHPARMTKVRQQISHTARPEDLQRILSTSSSGSRIYDISYRSVYLVYCMILTESKKKNETVKNRGFHNHSDPCGRILFPWSAAKQTKTFIFRLRHKNRTSPPPKPSSAHSKPEALDLPDAARRWLPRDGMSNYQVRAQSIPLCVINFLLENFEIFYIFGGHVPSV